MRTLGHILWHIPFLGFVNAILTWLLGLLLTALVITAPIGLGLMEYGKFLFLPFSYDMVSRGDLGERSNPVWGAYSFLIMLIYLPFGLILAIFGLFQVVSLALSIVGIPVAIVVAKSLTTFLNPVGKVCVHHTLREEMERRRRLRDVE